MNEFLLIGLSLIFFGLGMKLVLGHLSAHQERLDKPDCLRGHTWEERETAPGSDLFYLKCKVCQKTLKDILGD